MSIGFYFDEFEECAYNNYRLKTMRDAGYSDGFEEGVITFVKYLKKHSCFYDLDNYHSFSAIDIDNLDDLTKEFLDNR